MANNVWDIISSLTGPPPGQAPPSPPPPAIRPTGAPAYVPPPGPDPFTQWANVPGPPQSIGDVFDRLGRLLHAANTLGGAAGMIATQPYFARQAQIANAPGLANIPLPAIAGLAGTALAIPSLLPGGQEVAQSLGIAPPTGYGDIIGPAYQAAAEQSGGIAGLGAALDKLVETYSATPETVPLSKFVGENVSNPINYLGTIAKAPGIIGQAGRGTQEALNLPFRAAKAGLTHIPYFSELSDASIMTNLGRRMGDVGRNVEAMYGERNLQAPTAFGTGAAADPAILSRSVMATALATDSELAQQAAAKATENANAAKATIADRLAGGAGVSDVPAAAPTADAAGAAAAAGAPEAVLAGPGHDLNWLNNRAQGSYRFAQEGIKAAPGMPPHLPGADIPLDVVRKALDPADQADDWLGAVLANIRTEGVRSGQVVEETAKAQRRRGYQQGGGPGFVSERTGPLLFEPDTVHQVSDVVLRLQDLTKEGKPGGLPLGENVRLATGLRWMEQAQYGDTFPVPPPGEKGYYWAAIQRHMETLGDLPKPPEPTVPPPGGLPGPAPAAGGAPDFTLPGYEAPVMDAAQRATDALPANIGAGVAPERAMVPSNSLVAQLQNAVDTRQAGLDAMGRAQVTRLENAVTTRQAGLDALERSDAQAWAGPTEAAPVPGRPPAPEAGPPVVAPGAAPPPAGGAPATPGARGTEVPPAVRQELADALQSRRDIFAKSLDPNTRIAANRRVAAAQTAYDDALQASLEGLSFRPEVPPAPFEPGTTMRTDPAVAQELVNARQNEAIVRRESDDPQEIMAAIQRTKDARAAAEADLAAGFPSRAQILGADLAPHLAATREVIARHVPPDQMAEMVSHGQALGTAVDKLIPDLDRARALRVEAGLDDTATLKNVIGALKKQGSELVGEAQTIQDRWKSDILTGDRGHILDQRALDEVMRARGLDPDKFGGPAWLADMTAAWRAQALLSGAFHVKNVADSVIKSYLDAGKPGFLADAKPWRPDDLAGLIKDAWRDTTTNPNAALSPQMRVWGAIHELPVFDTMFAANNPTLTQALKALPKEDYENVLRQLTPVERELMRVDPTLAVPSSIKEAVGPLETGGFLGKIPFVDRVLAFNLKLTMGIEQSARGAKFIDAYNDGIQAGLSKGDAYQQGIAEANRLFFDYQGNMTNADRLFRNVFGFHTFATRNINYYAPILASNPILIQGLKGWEDYSNQMAEEGGYAANRRFAEAMKIPMVGGIGGGIAQFLFGRQGQVFWNPAVYFSIAEQTMSTPQEYRDEPLLGQVLSKARTYGLGLAPWVDIPLQMTGVYGARGPQSVTSLDSLIESAGQTALGRPVELPWKTVQRIRPPGQATPAALDIGIRQRLGEMSLEERPDFARVSPGQPIHPDFVRAMAEGPGNPLYEEAARDVGKERLAGVALGKVVGGGPGFQSQMAGRMAEAMGNQPKDLTKQGRQRYLAGRQAALAPEDLPLLTARREIGMKNPNEPGAQPAGEPAESPLAYIHRVWPTASPARQWALMQTQDPKLREAIGQYLGSRIHLHSVSPATGGAGMQLGR